jgi:sodium/potassium-transporting ATPase subunit alpha
LTLLLLFQLNIVQCKLSIPHYASSTYPLHSSFGIDEAQAKKLDDLDKNSSKQLGVEANFAELDWHTLPVDEVYQRLSTSARGLSEEQAVRKLKEYGRNEFSHPKSRWFRKTVMYLFGGFGSILFIASILVFVSWKPLGEPPVIANLALGIVLAIVWVIQALFSFYQDWSTSRVMASITNMLPDDCAVIRDGVQQHIRSTELVPGDILNIRTGDKLPADVRLVEVSSDVKFDRAILTGESFPVRGTVESTAENFLETGCIGMAGTHCVMGTAIGVVLFTGDSSVFGRLALLTSRPKGGLTNLEKEIYYFVIVIVGIMLTMIVLVVIVWYAIDSLLILSNML